MNKVWIRSGDNKKLVPCGALTIRESGGSFTIWNDQERLAQYSDFHTCCNILDSIEKLLTKECSAVEVYPLP